MVSSIVPYIFVVAFLAAGVVNLRVCWILWRHPSPIKTLHNSKSIFVRLVTMNTTRFDDNSVEYLWFMRGIYSFVAVIGILSMIFVLITVIGKSLDPSFPIK